MSPALCWVPGDVHPSGDHHRPQQRRPPLLTWLGSPGGTDRRVLLSTSPMRNSDTLQGRGLSVSRGTRAPHTPAPAPQSRAHVLLKETAMVSKAFSNSCLSDSLLHS